MTRSRHQNNAKGRGRALAAWLFAGLALLISRPMLLAAEPGSSEFPARFSAEIEQRLDETLARLASTPRAVPPERRASDARLKDKEIEPWVPRTPEVEALLSRLRAERNGRLARGFERFTLYAPDVSTQFRSAGVPPELALVGVVESGFDPRAVSPKQARGIWQFVPETGRRFGLRVGPSADERSDPQKSTRAAARYLSDLYETFGDWPLALAAYNAGESRVLSAITRGGSRDFWSLSRRQLLPAETRDYVPAVLATILFAQERGFSPRGPGATSMPTGTPVCSRRILYAGFGLSVDYRGTN